jgi:uncharacterized protein YcbK (DUF882 family)
MSALRRLSLIALLAGGFALAAPVAAGDESDAHAGAKKTSSSSKKPGKRSAKRSSSKKARRKVKVCSSSRGKRRCRYKKQFDGHSVRAAALREEPLTRPSGDIVFIPRNFREETYNVNIYAPTGEFDDAALARLDHGFRCKRTGNERAVDPRLYEMLSRIYDHFGRKPIHLVSGHRYQRNEKSRHYHAAAMDIFIEGVSIRELYEYADSLDSRNGGGMGVGLYPRSGFVHVDFRAPGADSYRWTDYSGSGSSKHKKKKAPKRVRSKNNS